MTKSVFLEKLTHELNRKNVADAADIIEEYEQHFAFKLADGYSEEEISAKLGDPKDIAAQYDVVPTESRSGKKFLTVIGLGISDFFFGVLCTLLWAWELIMAALVLVCGAVTVGLIANIREAFFSLIPTMPYHCSVILGIMFAALTVLSLVGTVYFFGFIRQLMRAFGRFHKNTLASASGRAVLPSLPVYPQFSAKVKRRLKKLAMTALAVFAVCFIIGFIVSAISAGSIQFWHTWRWFDYAG